MGAWHSHLMRRKIPALQTLLCFDAAARLGSLTRAAQALSLTQSAVSRQIAALESTLGLRLFERARHGVALTVSGADYAARIARQLDTLEQDTLDVMTGDAPDGDVHLACVPSFATQWLIPRLPDLAKRHPHLAVHIETRTRPFLFSDTRFDAALYAGTPEQVQRWAGTRHDVLLTESVVAVCSPALLGKRKSLKPTAMADMPLLQQSTRTDAWHHWFAALGVSAPKALSGPRYELFSMASAAASHGLGLALIPELLIESELASGALVLAHPARLPESRSYYLVRPEASASNRLATEYFWNWLLERAGLEMAQIPLPP